MRVLRLALGIFVVVQGIITHDWVFAAAGGFLAVMPILNIGCCGASGYCAAPPPRKMNEEPKDISYEEIR